MGKEIKRDILRKIHKRYYTCGSYTECGITAYSSKHIKNSWKGVTCRNCLKLKKEKKT